MVEKIAISVICTALFSGIAFATAGYTTTCGKRFMAPDQEYFETYGEWESFIKDMNKDLCGTSDVTIISDDLDGHYQMY